MCTQLPCSYILLQVKNKIFRYNRIFFSSTPSDVSDYCQSFNEIQQLQAITLVSDDKELRENNHRINFLSHAYAYCPENTNGRFLLLNHCQYYQENKHTFTSFWQAILIILVLHLSCVIVDENNFSFSNKKKSIGLWLSIFCTYFSSKL